MKTTLLIPVAGVILALAGCSDSEPVQSSSTSKPAPAPTASTTEVPVQRGNQASTDGTAKTNLAPVGTPAGAVAGTGIVDANTPPVQRGDQAVVAGAAKLNADPATPSSTAATGNPPVLRGEQAEVVGQTTTTITSTDAVAPAPAGGTSEAKLIPTRDAEGKSDAQTHAADDSGRNKREDGTQLTPLDQGTSDADVKITQGIRSTVVGRDDLSTNAKNAKIITRDGVVTLRGPVANTQEREAIASIAKAQVGVTKIDNHLEPLQQ